jgi:Transposase DDE domain
VLWEEADRAGYEEGFIKRRRNLSGSSFVQTLVMGYWGNPQATTSDLNQAAGAVGIQISRQGIEQRYSPEAAAVLKRVLEASIERMISANPVNLPVIRRFSAVRIMDSSTITLPAELASVWSGCGEDFSGLKISVDWDLKSGRLDGPHLADGRRHDQKLVREHQTVQAGEVVLRDLGYFNLETFADLESQEAYWVSYCKQGTVMTTHDGLLVNELKVLPKKVGGSLDLAIYLGKEEHLAARLVAVRLPAALTRKRRKHLREIARRKQQSVSERALKLAAWLILVTNIPASLLTLDEVCVLLGCRWQIERLFRLWKEDGQVDEWRSHKPWHILCEVYAKLIACILQHWIILLALWATPDRALHQASKTIRQHVYWLATVLRDELACSQMLTRLCRTLRSGCKMGRSANSPHTYERLLAFESLSLN